MENSKIPPTELFKVVSLGNTKLGDLYDDAIATLLQTWEKIIKSEKQYEEHRLTISVLISYIYKLSDLKQMKRWFVLLPACFETYAFCVETILKNLVDYSLKLEGIIRISTLLTKPLSKWYNISTQMSKGKYCNFTLKDWEDYKNIIKTLRTKPEVQPGHRIQLRRFLPKKLKDYENLCVYENPNNKKLTIREAKNEIIPNCMKLSEHIENALINVEPQDQDFLIHLIAEHKPDPKTDCKHPNWQKIVDNFIEQYHDRAQEPGNIINGQTIGVFCSFVDYPEPPYEYDDLFIVEIEEKNEVFGIGYHLDPLRELGGIVFLPDFVIRELLNYLNNIWQKPFKI